MARRAIMLNPSLRKSAGIACLYAASSMVGALAEQPAPAKGTQPNRIAWVETKYTCAQASEIKSAKDKYGKLDPTERGIVDLKWNQCDAAEKQKSMTEQQRQDSDSIVAFVNPAPTKKSSKVLWGTAKRKDLDNLEKNCAGAGKAAGVALVVAGPAIGDEAGRVGKATYSFSDVTCKEFKSRAPKDEAMIFLGPTQVVAAALAGKLTGSDFDAVPLLSDRNAKLINQFVSRSAAPEIQVLAADEAKLKGPGSSEIEIKKGRLKAKLW